MKTRITLITSSEHLINEIMSDPSTGIVSKQSVPSERDYWLDVFGTFAIVFSLPIGFVLLSLLLN